MYGSQPAPGELKVSDPDDKRDNPIALPSPELNPLTNSVLGRHMGRWAEVYFTSPPEKREQAVQELLRQLELEPSASETSIAAATAAGEPGPASEEAGTFSQAISLPEEEFVQCGSCGQIVLAEQKFCGGCGSALPTREENGPAKWRFEEQETAGLQITRGPFLDDGVNWQRGVEPFAEDAPGLFEDREVGRQRRSRRTTAVALTILVVTLFYVAARETAAWLRSHDATQVAAKAVPSAPDLSRPAQTAKSDGITQATVPDNAVPHRTQSRQAGSSPSVRGSPTNRPQGSAATLLSAKATPSPKNAADEKLNLLLDHGRPGTEELAIAENYLRGTPGKARDSSQAAQWLWKSVAKQNAAAALLLSDLYISGDGVPQNCDQARLLLYAAARKRIPGAGERIRNLPKRGCQ